MTGDPLCDEEGNGEKTEIDGVRHQQLFPGVFLRFL